MTDKLPHVFLYTGIEIHPKFLEGMWRISVLGNNYCSGSFNGLLELIGFFHSIYTSMDLPAPVIDPTVKAISILSGSTSLDDRQKALKFLEALAANGNTTACDMVSKVKEKHTSFGASYITKCLGRADFSQVLPYEISDLVPNIMHRSELIHELADRVKL